MIAVAWILIAIFAPLIAPDNPLAQNFPPAQARPGTHLFGTDELGRDVLSRVIYGSRVTLPIALVLVVARGLDRQHHRRGRRLLPRLRRRDR